MGQRSRVAVLLGAMVFVLTACTRVVDPPDHDVSSLVIDSSGGATQIAVGGQLSLTATLDGRLVPATDLDWSSLNPQVASVDDDGVVTGAGQGQTVITARTRNGLDLSGSLEVSVIGPVLEWTRQYFTQDYDRTAGIAIGTSGTSYLAGTTERSGSGRGLEFAYSWVLRIDGDGSSMGGETFAEQLRAIAFHGATGVAVVGDSEPATATVRLLAADGSTSLWYREIPGRWATDVAFDAAGDVLVTGYLPGPLGVGDMNGFVRKYSPTGSVLWDRVFNSDDYDLGTYVGTDASNDVYVLSGYGRARVRKFSATGELGWLQEVAPFEGNNVPGGLAVDATGGVSVAVSGGAVGGDVAVEVRRLTPDGALAWSRSFGGSGSTTVAWDLAVDASGDTYVVGSTDADLDGQHAGNLDGYVRAYGESGNVRWTRQMATTERDVASAVAADGSGAVLVGGATAGALASKSSPNDEAFLLRLRAR